jgi:hypothetical protein
MGYHDWRGGKSSKYRLYSTNKSHEYLSRVSEVSVKSALGHGSSKCCSDRTSVNIIECVRSYHQEAQVSNVERSYGRRNSASQRLCINTIDKLRAIDYCAC